MDGYRHAGKRRLKPKSIAMLLLYGLVLAGLIVAGLIWDQSSDEHTETFGSLDGRFKSDIELTVNGETLSYRENHITNYLLIGTDREGVQGADHQSGGQADFLLVLSVDRVKRTVTPMMIDRDTMACVDTYGIFGNPSGSQVMQICLAQAFSGTDVSGGENTANAVSRLLSGVKIDRCLVMGLDGIPVLNDAVGGVTVTLTSDLTALDPSLQKGETVLLSGELAEEFVRGRTTLADGTNAARMERQTMYLEQLIRRIQTLAKEDEGAVENIILSVSEYVEANVSTSILVNESGAFTAYEWNDLKTISGTHRVGSDGFTEFWPDETALTALVAQIWFQ